MISIIAALSSNHAIGLNNKMPWHLPADINWFKRHTLNKLVIMGRLTWESIGRPLPNRTNVVISNKLIKNHHQIRLVKSIYEAMSICDENKESMVIGGGSIYRQFLSKAQRMYLTHIDIHIEGDTYFLNYNSNNWRTVFIEYHKSNMYNPYNYCFEILERVMDDC